jgi:hypothetical protein
VKRFIQAVLLISMSAVHLFAQTSYNDTPPNSFPEIEKMFSNPPVEYRSAPLWVWNDDLTEQEIDHQLQELKAGGMGGVFIHPRPGLVTPYLSDEWFALCRYTVDKAAELGMQVWLYDENSYPSGFAGGNVPAEMPESYNQGQGLVMSELEHLPDNYENTFSIVLKNTKNGLVNVEGLSSQEKKQKGEYYLFKKSFYENSPWHGGYSYVDLLYEGVTEKFIELTMAGYEKVIGHEFGKLVPGIFTDEPNINPPRGMKWTPALYDEFEKKWGYDLKNNLPSLFKEIGDWRKVRHNYYSLLLDLFTERWSKPWHNYCEEHNLNWTGHYWEHGWPKLADGPDNMAMYAWHQIPAIDLLMNQYVEDVNAQFGNVRIVKELASVANQMGRTRKLSETYGAGGWDLRFEDMKRIGDWQYVLGVNFLNQHLSYVTIEGARKRDHPQSFSYHEPWWDLYKHSANYFSRLSLALSSGKQINRILVLAPTTTAWLYYTPNNPHSSFNDLGRTFQQFVQQLEKNQIEYDLGSEYVIKEFGKNEGNLFVVGKRKYDLVVIPSMVENINSDILDQLETFVKNGGKVLSFVDSIPFVDGAASDKILKLAQNNPSSWIDARTFSEDKVNDLLKSDDIQFDNPQLINGKLFHHRRILESGNLVFLVNTSDFEWSKGSFNIDGKSVQELDLNSGKTSPYPSKSLGKNIVVNFDIPPSGSLLLYANEAPGVSSGIEKEADVKILKPEGQIAVTRKTPNVVTLDYCDLTLDGKTDKDIYFYQAADKVFSFYGFKGNPWSRSVQYKTAILDRNNFSANSGFTADFYIDIEKNVDINSLQLAVERPELWDVKINGHKQTATKEKYWLDRAIGLYNIGECVIPGKNKISLTASPMTVHTELEPIYVLGNFGVQSLKKGWKIVPTSPLTLGSWAEQGMPFYSDKTSYTNTFNISLTGKRYIVKLTDWLGSIAQVYVNGKEAGIVGWPPYELDVTDYMVKGTNSISVVVCGTLKNLLGPHHIGKVRGTAWPASFENAPPHLPAGFNYDVINYGLFRDFILFESDGPPQKVYWRNYKTAMPHFFDNKTIFTNGKAEVKILPKSKDDTIRFTLDGSSPAKNSKIYLGPIELYKSAIITARAFKGNQIESNVVTKTVSIVDRNKNGVNYEYYEGLWLDIPNFNELTVNEKGSVFNIGFEGIGRRQEAFAIRYKSLLNIEKAGEYTLYLNSNDGSLMFVNDELIVDNGGGHGAQERQGSITLKPGKHQLEIHYFDSGGAQTLEASYKGPGIIKQLIPPDKLILF